MDECGQMAWGREVGMGRREVRGSLWCSWHPEPPLDEEERESRGLVWG